jgi:hypothetical protein
MKTLSVSEAKMKLSGLIDAVIIAIGPRKKIYEETYQLLRKEK